MNQWLLLVFSLIILSCLNAQDSLRLYLNFNDNLIDQSSYNHDGAPLFNAEFIENGCDEALLIKNSITDAIIIDRAVFNQLSDFTVSVFVKLDGFNTNNNLISCANNSQANEFLIGYNSLNDSYADGWGLIINNTKYILGGEMSLDDFAWHHIVITREGIVGRLYIDGQEIGSPIILDDKIFDVSENGTFIGQDQDCVGGCFELNQNWFGAVDELKVFSKALAISELVNEPCLDCTGTINGTKILDGCNVCLEPNDPTFNQSCIDCNGVLNGTTILDNCGLCLEPCDPSFNKSCRVEHEIYIPYAFSPNLDEINDEFRLFASQGIVSKIIEYTIYDRWDKQIYKATHFDIESNIPWWKGKFRGERMNPGVFVYKIEVEFIDGERKIYSGDVLLIK